MKKLSKDRKHRHYKTWLTSILISLLITIAASAVLSIVFLNDLLNENAIVYMIPIVQIVSVWTGAFIACKRCGEKIILTSTIVAAGFYFILIAFTILLFDCSFNRWGIGAIMCTCGAILSNVMCLISNKRKPHKRHQL